MERLGSALVTAQEADYQKKSSRSGTSHVTSSTTSIDAQTRKARLTASLYDDALLGPVYRQWCRVLIRATLSSPVPTTVTDRWSARVACP